MDAPINPVKTTKETRLGRRWAGVLHRLLRWRKAFGALPPSSSASPTLLMEEVRAICFDPKHRMTPWHRPAACPACAGERLDPAFRKYEFAHVRCRDCGLVSLAETPPDAVLDALYAGAYYTQVRELFELPRLTEQGGMTPLSAPEDILRELVEQAGEGQATGIWLDAGGGFGAFADYVRQHLSGWDVILNDLNPRSLAIAQDVLKLATTGASPEDLNRDGRRYDVISAISVLEHVPDPLGFVANYARLLKPGGRLVLVTPNLTPLSAMVARASSPAVTPPFHINLFNPVSLKALLDRSGLFVDMTIVDKGPPAFALIQHLDFSEHFDITIPTPENPAPRTVMLKPFPERMAERINALAPLEPIMADHFAETDGRTYLVAVARVA